MGARADLENGRMCRQGVHALIPQRGPLPPARNFEIALSTPASKEFGSPYRVGVDVNEVLSFLAQ